MAGFRATCPACILALIVLVLLVAFTRGEIHGSFKHGVASGDPTHSSIIIWTRVTPSGRDQPDNVDPTWEHEFDVTWRVSTKPPWRVIKQGADAFVHQTESGEWRARTGRGQSEVSGSSYPSVAMNEAFIYRWDDGSVIKTGTTTATSQTDWTVKLDVDGLEPNTRYYYAFEVGSAIVGDDDDVSQSQNKKNILSPTGTFTLPPAKGTPYPDTKNELLFPVFSCANWAFGHFHAYDAAWKGWGVYIAAWLHLGDYYYEYGTNHYPSVEDAVSDRWASLFPRNETVTLEDYRLRHATHRMDLSLQQLHASAPVIAMWDDHEIANNPWVGGAEDHNGNEGDYETRVRNAIKAYHEWLPTREPINMNDWDDLTHGPKAYNRSVHFGNLISFLVLETRVIARSDPNSNPYGNVFKTLQKMIEDEETNAAPNKWPGSALEQKFKLMASTLDSYRSNESFRLLGSGQLDWVETETKGSRDRGVKWQAFAQASPVMNGASPDIELASEQLDRECVVKPPGKYVTWRDAVFDWVGYETEDESSQHKVGVGGRAVNTNSARALLALGKYKINWDFDDWRGYVAERVRLLRIITQSSNRALILGGDSHDAWAGVLGNDRQTWGVADESENSSKDFFDSAVVAEFDCPGVTPPGAYESSFPWVPSELIDQGHLIANKRTMLYGKTADRGFLLLKVTSEKVVGEFVFTPSVRDVAYVPECGAAFSVTENALGKKMTGDGEAAGAFEGTSLLQMTRTPCSAFPDSLFQARSGQDENGYVGATRSRSIESSQPPPSNSNSNTDPYVSFAAVFATAFSCALAGALIGYWIPKRTGGRNSNWWYRQLGSRDNGSTETRRRSRRSASRSQSPPERRAELEMQV
ncbi:alkaline phosphatase D family protein [bacterium]|nr:alkaline phosphatase D family protein [bacterium]